jgi:AcrR family transcriptional regulator
MDGESPFRGEPEDSREAIMRATYRALQEYGYAGLSIQRIADEAGLSKSTFYHHYDGKDDLLLSFLDFMLERSRQEIMAPRGDDALTELRAVVRLAVTGEPSCGEPLEDPHGDDHAETFVELRAQAIHDEDYRDRITEIDAAFRDQVASVVRRGIEQGLFRDVDPDQVAELLVTVVMGGMIRRVTSASLPVDAVLEEADEYIERRLLAEGAEPTETA